MPRITIIGTGLIGTSMALALKQAQVRDLDIVGTDYDARPGPAPRNEGLSPAWKTRLAAAIDGADIVVLATPVLAMRDLMEVLGPELQEDCVITDVGSSKTTVLGWAEELLRRKSASLAGIQWPGRETSGPENADAIFSGTSRTASSPGLTPTSRLCPPWPRWPRPWGAKPFFINQESTIVSWRR